MAQTTPHAVACYAPSERQAEQYRQEMENLLLTRREHCLVGDTAFYALWGTGELCVGPVNDDGSLSWDDIVAASFAQWTPELKDSLDRLLVKPVWQPYPPQHPSQYPRRPIEELEALGCCVVVFGPNELRGLHPEVLQDLLQGMGMDAIDAHAPRKPLV